jgi:hypothetical protein
LFGKSARVHRRHVKRLPAPTRPEPDTCELCGGPPGNRASIHLDHCHQTGVFRGWLCNSCNIGLGALGDDLDAILARLTRYRDKFASEAWLAIPGSGLAYRRSEKILG